MKLTAKAKKAIFSHLQDDSTLVPGVTWMCCDNYSDAVKDGYYVFCFYDGEQVLDSNLINIEDVTFAIDVPASLQDQLDKAQLDFVNSKFVFDIE